MHILHLNQRNQRNQILFQYLRDKKKKKEGASEKGGGGGENSPISSPLDPCLNCRPAGVGPLLWLYEFVFLCFACIIKLVGYPFHFSFAVQSIYSN